MLLKKLWGDAVNSSLNREVCNKKINMQKQLRRNILEADIWGKTVEKILRKPTS